MYQFLRNCQIYLVLGKTRKAPNSFSQIYYSKPPLLRYGVYNDIYLYYDLHPLIKPFLMQYYNNLTFDDIVKVAPPKSL